MGGSHQRGVAGGLGHRRHGRAGPGPRFCGRRAAAVVAEVGGGLVFGPPVPIDAVVVEAVAVGRVLAFQTVVKLRNNLIQKSPSLN